MFRGIRTRLLGLVVATVVPFTALIGAGLWNQWRSDQAQASRSALIEARLLAARLDDQIRELDNLLVGLSQAVSVNPQDIQANDLALRRAKSELPDYIGSLLLSAPDGGNIGTSFEPAAEGRTYIGDRDYFRAIVANRGGVAVGDPVHGRTTGNWVTSVARGLKTPDGRLTAVLGVGIQLEQFQRALTVNELPADSIVQIINADGRVILRSDSIADWAGRKLRDYELTALHAASKQASASVLWPDHVERITGSAAMVETPWLVSVGLPKQTVLSNVVSRLSWGAAASLITLLVALAIASAFSARIISPLQQLSADASALAAGELTHRTAVDTKDEVGALALTFNTMAAALEERHRELDQAREAAFAEAIERARLEQQERQSKETLAAVIDASPVAVVCSDTERNVVLWSRAAETIFGYSAEETMGRPNKLVPPEAMAESQSLFERCLRGEVIRDLEVKRRRKDGSMVDIRLAATPVYDSGGKARGVVWTYDDITLRKKAERQLNQIAHYDQLTGLPNRVSLKNELASLLSIADGRAAHSIALFDLDGFKDVNDTDGHSTGDELLVEVARRMSCTVGDAGRVYRLGGDEFVVVIPDCGDPRRVTLLVESMLHRLAEPIEINEHILHIGGSAGIAIAPLDGTSVDELIANADLALYKAKADGGRTYRLFVPLLRAQAQTRRGLQVELRRAFDESEFELHFQPYIRLADDAVVGAEALLRWRHPQRGLVGPGAFIQTLAESSLASAVGAWIIRDACAKTAAWRAMGLSLNRISVNLFPAQCRDRSLIVDIEDALQMSGLSADMLELEISETFALQNDDAIVPLQELHDRGIKLAFDDFGTGYASLSYLTKFPVSRIKIDRSFITKVTEDAENAAIVRSLIAMAHNLSLGIIAEGVETEAQARFLLEERCEEAQGFLYAKPLSAADFEAYLRNRRLAAHVARPQQKPLYRSISNLPRPYARSSRKGPRA
ncbi:MAG TPA: EAL domain-containing protein [Xanthobacteraceae bacterium]|nr:EAL domain-containing protein [Xanthobacteraceae bacterium]